MPRRGEWRTDAASVAAPIAPSPAWSRACVVFVPPCTFRLFWHLFRHKLQLSGTSVAHLLQLSGASVAHLLQLSGASVAHLFQLSSASGAHLLQLSGASVAHVWLLLKEWMHVVFDFFKLMGNQAVRQAVAASPECHGWAGKTKEGLFSAFSVLASTPSPPPPGFL